MALNLAPFGRWTLRDKAAQRRLALRQAPKMFLYLKRRWNESRGDQYDAWGKSWWYFEVEPDGSALRQIEQYDSGVSLRYGAERNEDEYGFLTDQTVDIRDPDFEEISAAEFELVWHQSRARNVES